MIMVNGCAKVGAPLGTLNVSSQDLSLFHSSRSRLYVTHMRTAPQPYSTFAGPSPDDSLRDARNRTSSLDFVIRIQRFAQPGWRRAGLVRARRERVGFVDMRLVSL